MYNIFFVSNADHKENRTLIVLANACTQWKILWRIREIKNL